MTTGRISNEHPAHHFPSYSKRKQRNKKDQTVIQVINWDKSFFHDLGQGKNLWYNVPLFFFLVKTNQRKIKLLSRMKIAFSLHIYVCVFILVANLSVCYGKIPLSLYFSIQFSNEEFFTQDLSTNDVSLLLLTLLVVLFVQCASHFIFHNRKSL